MVYNMRYSEVNNSVIENSCGRKTEKVLWTKNFGKTFSKAVNFYKMFSKPLTFEYDTWQLD